MYPKKRYQPLLLRLFLRLATILVDHTVVGMILALLGSILAWVVWFMSPANPTTGWVLLALLSLIGLAAAYFFQSLADCGKLVREVRNSTIPPMDDLDAMELTIEKYHDRHAFLPQFALRMVFVIIAAYSLSQLTVEDRTGPFLEAPSRIDMLSETVSTGSSPIANTISNAKADAPPHGPPMPKAAQHLINDAHQLGAVMGWANLWLLTGYWVLSVLFYYWYRWNDGRTLMPKTPAWAKYLDADQRGKDTQPAPGLLGSSYLDVLFITLFMCVSLKNGSWYSMAHLIPVSGIWWMSKHLRYMFALILVSIIGMIIAAQKSDVHFASVGQIKCGLGIDITFLMIALALWSCIGLWLLIVRGVRETLRLRAMKEDLYLHLLEEIGEQQKHIVFAKTNDRKLVYGSPLMLKWLTELHKARGTGKRPFLRTDGQPISELTPVRLEDIMFKTDCELGIDRASYLRK